MLIAGPNLTMDRTLAIAELRPGEVLRFDRVVVTPGGKGLNVGRAAHALGHPAVLVSLLPGRTGEAAAALIADEGVELHAGAVLGRAALDGDHPGARRAHHRAQRARAAGRRARVGRLRARDRGAPRARTACSSARAACRPAARPTPTAAWRRWPTRGGRGEPRRRGRARRCCARSTPRPSLVTPNLAEAETRARARQRRPVGAERRGRAAARAGGGRGARARRARGRRS